MHAKAEEILAFWLDEVGPEGWYAGGEALDARCRRFEEDWERGVRGDFAQWTVEPRGALALTILLDQFPRNMFRGSPKAFSSDRRARITCKGAIARDRDLGVEGAPRQFFYLPLMHSENLADQDRSVRMFLLRFESPDSLRHARAHRDIIRRFGRFPFRNAVLGRASTPEEEAWMAAGGYPAEVEALA